VYALLAGDGQALLEQASNVAPRLRDHERLLVNYVEHHASGNDKLLRSQEQAFDKGRPCLGDKYTNKIRVTIDRAEYVGDGRLLTCTEPGGSIIRVRLPPRVAVPAIRSEVLISWPSDACSLLKASARA
jgi:hypothetical protein